MQAVCYKSCVRKIPRLKHLVINAEKNWIYISYHDWGDVRDAKSRTPSWPYTGDWRALFTVSALVAKEIRCLWNKKDGKIVLPCEMRNCETMSVRNCETMSEHKDRSNPLFEVAGRFEACTCEIPTC